MPAQFTGADALREYYSGAASDGGAQSDANASFGHFRSSTEAASFGISITNAIAGVTILYAGGGNPSPSLAGGIGTLTALDGFTLTWKPPSASLAGPVEVFTGTETRTVVGTLPGQYLRITGATPFTPGASLIRLPVLPNNLFGFDNVSLTNAATGISEYRASIVKNVSAALITGFARSIGQLGSPQVSNVTWLGASGSGTITTTGSLATWNPSGWCQIQSSGGTLKEVVYYSARTATTLTIPTAGRARLGTTATAGSATNIIRHVPGVAIAIDPAGVQTAGTGIQTIANATTAPAGVTWNMGLTSATGLIFSNMAAGTEVGIWVWREIPPGAMAVPAALIQYTSSFNSF